jgi:hypothetical protein
MSNSDDGPIDWQKEYFNLLKQFRNLGLQISVTANNLEAQIEERINPELRAKRQQMQQQGERGVQGPDITP